MLHYISQSNVLTPGPDQFQTLAFDEEFRAGNDLATRILEPPVLITIRLIERQWPGGFRFVFVASVDGQAAELFCCPVSGETHLIVYQ